jgi:hypothetical protein
VVSIALQELEDVETTGEIFTFKFSQGLTVRVSSSYVALLSLVGVRELASKLQAATHRLESPRTRLDTDHEKRHICCWPSRRLSQTSRHKMATISNLPEELLVRTLEHLAYPTAVDIFNSDERERSNYADKRYSQRVCCFQAVPSRRVAYTIHSIAACAGPMLCWPSPRSTLPSNTGLEAGVSAFTSIHRDRSTITAPENAAETKS